MLPLAPVYYQAGSRFISHSNYCGRVSGVQQKAVAFPNGLSLIRFPVTDCQGVKRFLGVLGWRTSV